MLIESTRTKRAGIALTAACGLALTGFLVPGSAVAAESVDPQIYTEADPVKNLETWALPTDPYMGNKVSDLEEAARNILIAKCMRERGYTDVVFEYDLNAPDTPNLAANNMWIHFTPEHAAKYGYRYSPDPRVKANTLPDKYASTGNTPADFDRSFAGRECGIAAQAALLDRDPEEYRDDLWSNLYPISEEEEWERDLRLVDHWFDGGSALNAIEEKWRACMKDAKVAQLPQSPQMVGFDYPPNLEETRQWQRYYKDNGEASPEEKAYAALDAQCRVESGWNQIQYDLQWDARQEYVEANRGTLEQLRANYLARAKKAAEVIVANQ